jgi:hypothetical protein
MTAIAIVTLITGVLIFVLCLPLIGRQIEMNNAYGIRIKAAFESEQRWYDINAFGGRQMAAWSFLIMATGIAGFFISPEYKDNYLLASVAVTLLSVAIPIFQTQRWSRKK